MANKPPFTVLDLGYKKLQTKGNYLLNVNIFSVQGHNRAFHP